MTSHSRSYSEELQRSIFVQIASAIGDLESAMGIITRMTHADPDKRMTLDAVIEYIKEHPPT